MRGVNNLLRNRKYWWPVLIASLSNLRLFVFEKIIIGVIIYGIIMQFSNPLGRLIILFSVESSFCILSHIGKVILSKCKRTGLILFTGLLILTGLIIEYSSLSQQKKIFCSLRDTQNDVRPVTGIVLK